MQEIKITRAQTLKEKPESSTLVFGKSMTDHMFIVDYDAGQGWHDPRIVPSRSILRPRCSTTPRRSLRA